MAIPVRRFRVKIKLVIPFALVGGFLMVCGPMFAHHSAAMYDREHPVTLKGTVTKLAFFNPHVRIYFQVKDENDNVAKWIAATATPQRLHRAGWNAKTLNPGDEVSVTCAPARDGRKICSVRRLVGPNGKVLREGAE